MKMMMICPGVAQLVEDREGKKEEGRMKKKEEGRRKKEELSQGLGFSQPHLGAT